MSDDNPIWGCFPRGPDCPMPPNRACVLTYTIRRGIARYIRRFEEKFIPTEWAEVAWYDKDEEDEGPYDPKKPEPPEIYHCLVKSNGGKSYCVKFVVNKRGVKVECVYSLFPVF